MKDKDKICHICGSKMKYRGNRRFVCKKCNYVREYEKDFEPSDKNRWKFLR
jgi:tRNA(Ile2) C34 agmatinyltransferase TiaS